MREIEFRGKRPNNGVWVYGDLEYSRKGCLARIHTYKDDGRYNLQYIVSEITIGQYIGLKDKNGRKIYEGDIVRRSDGNIGYVEFNNGIFKFTMIGQDNNVSTPISYYIENKVEIIGNIHDNPELLKKE